MEFLMVWCELFLMEVVDMILLYKEYDCSLLVDKVNQLDPSKTDLLSALRTYLDDKRNGIHSSWYL